MKRLFGGFIALALFVSLTACSDPSLKKIAQAELDIEQAQAAAIVSLNTLHNSGSISDADVQTVGAILVKVNQADAQAIMITKNLATLDPASRSTLRDLIVPVLNAVNFGLSQGIVNIQNPTAKAAIAASLSAIATSLTIIQSSLGG